MITFHPINSDGTIILNRYSLKTLLLLELFKDAKPSFNLTRFK